MGANIAETLDQTSTVGTQSMDPADQTLKAALESIRDVALNALNQIGSEEERAMRWQCKACR